MNKISLKNKISFLNSFNSNPLKLMIAILLLFLMTPELFSFNTFTRISGVVLDRESSAPIPNAVLHLLNTEIYITTKIDGSFFLDEIKEGKYQIKVTHLAYQENLLDLELAENTPKNIKIYLIPKSIEISPVVVIDRGYRSKFEEINEAAGVLEGKKLQREMGFNLAATLKNETGLAIRSMGPAPARPVIRGLGGNRVHISEDGQATTDLSATSPDHAVTLEPFTVNRIEVLRGPKVLLYTSSTLGGVVNVVREEIPEELHHEIHGVFGLFGETVNEGYLGSSTIQIPFEPLSIKFELSRRKAADVSTPIQKLRNSYAENLNYSGGASYFHTYGFLGASFRSFELNYGVPGGFVGAHPNGVRIEMKRHQFNFKSNYLINSQYLENLEIIYSTSKYRHKEFEASGRLGAEFSIINNLGSIHLNHKSIALFSEGMIGLSVEHRDFDIGGFVFTSPTKSFNFSVYLYENLSLQRFSFELAGRINYDKLLPQKESANANIGLVKKREFNTFSLSFSSLYEVSNIVYFGLNISKSSRVPTIEELYSEGPHLAAYSYEVGNPNLPAENGFGAEFFVYHKFNGLYFNLTFFRNQFDNFIIPRNTGEINYSTFLPIYATTGIPALLYGLENQIEWKPLSYITLFSNLSFTRGKIKKSENSLPQIPPLKGNGGIRLSFYDYLFGLSVEYAAKQTKVDMFEESTAGYAVLNGFIQYSFITGNLVHNASISVDNIFNKEYRNHLSRVKVILPEAGRNFRITYKLFF
jgi:iron complex outermembrane receptor protein